MDRALLIGGSKGNPPLLKFGHIPAEGEGRGSGGRGNILYFISLLPSRDV